MISKYNLYGMTCAVCATTIEKKIHELDGVYFAKVNLTTEVLKLEYDEGVLSNHTVITAIQDIGYDAEIRKKTEIKVFGISGMTCVSCANKIENVFKSMTYVKYANVNFEAEKLSVISTDPSAVAKISDVVKILGYQLYALSEDEEQVIYKTKEQEQQQQKLRRRFITSMLFTIPIIYVASANILELPLFEIIDPTTNPSFFSMTQLILTAPVILANKDYYKIGFSSLMKKHPKMDTLIALGTSIALLYGIFATIQIILGNYLYTKELYFGASAVILTLIRLEKYLELVTKDKTSEAIQKLMRMTPKTAKTIRHNKEQTVPIESVLVGDVIIAKPGERLPLDGIVISGKSLVDESMPTGENLPVEKKANDRVIGPSKNKNGVIRYETTHIGKDTTLAQISKLVDDAQSSKAPIEKLADIISSYFVYIIIVVAIGSSLLWVLSGQSISFSFSVLISVLVITCPCAFGLATRTAIMVGMGKGAENGILIKSGEALETTHHVKTILFDKTGTITKGKPVVTDIILAENMDRNFLLFLAASAEKASEHPLGEAIVKEAEIVGIDLVEPSIFESFSGLGVNAILKGTEVSLGNEEFFKQLNIDISKFKLISDNLVSKGKTPVYIANDRIFLGIIAIEDTIKPASALAIQKLNKLGLNVVMLTGDNKLTAQAIANQVGITNVISEVLPQEKAYYVKMLQSKEHRVAMVGNGINDALALAQADIGFVMGSGTDIAMESADIILMNDDLQLLMSTIDLSKKTIWNIKSNLYWAFAYNMLSVPIAMGVLNIFWRSLLSPLIAGVAMSFSSITVLLNSLRLKDFKVK
ncbi:heavy metal translocating P-type ATPase [Enterococcus faecium]|uniref:heavy metal translocating P-type ATPase n=1 Tax=Enterococcus faecium TaxID=1352 RepID=UPI002413E2CF|nr:heavy metal translocating P-type ATPase [Enterococcus faecium]MDG4579865.1 heavy metal translocating P-type ATPase [Enterococcus faecium]